MTAGLQSVMMCPNSMAILFNRWSISLRALCPDLPNQSTLTERTSDNRRLGTSNDTTYVAKHPILRSQLN